MKNSGSIGLRAIFRLILATGLFSAQLSVRPSPAFNARAYDSLRQLDPAMRLEQVCDMEAMDRIGREDKRFHPDRAKSSVIVPPQHLGDLLKATGAAFRSNGSLVSAFARLRCLARPLESDFLQLPYRRSHPN
jgi:hypothetical protein